MDKFVSDWCAYLEAQEYAPNTIELYAGSVSEMLAGRNPKDIAPEDVEAWMLKHKDWSASTKRYHYAAVKNFFKYLVNRKTVDVNPSDILPNVAQRKHVDESVDHGKEDRVYSREDLVAMLQYHDVRFRSLIKRDRAIIALMAGSGMRASEVAWLNVGTILNRRGNTIFAMRKGQNIRKIVIADFAFKYIEDYLRGRTADPDAPLFITREGNRIDRHTIYNMLAARQKALGLRTGTHNMRYTVLNAVERNANPVVARDIAGQKSIAITNNYLVSNDEEREEAISSLPWGDMF